MAERVGVLITHGTDTMAWTLAFLRYAIKGNHANIVLTGSQIPLPTTVDFSDAYANLQSSMRVLTSFAPPNVLAVFNYGEDVFSDSLIKTSRWSNVAFAGDRVATVKEGAISAVDPAALLPSPAPLDRLHVITTGGTIEASVNDEGVLVPGNNLALGYVTSRFSEYFKDLSQDRAFAIDSSDLSVERLQTLASLVFQRLRETNSAAAVDVAFEPRVRIVSLDPLKTIVDVERECDGAAGIVLAGFGGGNVPTDEASGRSLLPLIRGLAEREIPIVLSSQVPIGAADFVYANGLEAVRAGAFSAVDMSVPECQVRLGYLLGHREPIRALAQEAGCPFLTALEYLFMSGVKLRNARSRALFERAREYRVHVADLPVNRNIDEVCAQAAAALREVE